MNSGSTRTEAFFVTVREHQLTPARMMPSKLSRLRQMDLAEVAWRARGAADVWRGRLSTRISPPRWDRRDLARALSPQCVPPGVPALLQHGHWSEANEKLAEHFSKRPPRFVIAPSMRSEVTAQIRRRFPTATEHAVHRASKVLAGRYDILGYENLPFDGRQWHRDPVHGTTAPQRFWAAVPYLEPTCGDHKVVWELNRHQHWMALGRAYWLSDDERYRTECLLQLDSWLTLNPPLIGINWSSMLELAFRSISWTWALQFFTRRGAVDASPWMVDLLAGIDRQLQHVERHLSYYFSPNTHLLGEALALYVVSRALPELKASARRENVGRRVLVQEIGRQIAADGGHCERSTHYHRYTLDFYLLALAVARITDDPVAGVFERTCARLAEAARALTDNEGRFPHLGDDDGGTLLPLTDRSADDMRDSFAIAAALTGRLDLLVEPDAEEMWWMLAHPRFADAVSRVERAPRPLPPASMALPSTGYYVSRYGTDHLVIDGGPHGYMNAGHAHADALSLTLTRGGRPLLIDTGTGVYTIDPATRDRFRSTALHNTLTLGDRSQSLSRGPFQWHTMANATARRWRSSRRFDYFVGTHDGYAPFSHHRHVLMLHDDLLIVADYVSAAPVSSSSGSTQDTATAAAHPTRTHWHIAPSWTVTTTARGATMADDLQAVEFVTTGGTLEQFRGDDATGLGWYAPVYGRVEPTTTLRVTTHGEPPLWIVSVFGLDAANPPRDVVIERITITAGDMSYGTLVRIDRAASVDRVVIAEPSGVSAVQWRADGLSSDAALAFSRAADGAVVALAVVDATTVHCADAPNLSRTYPARVSDVYLAADERPAGLQNRKASECAELLDSSTARR